MRKKLTLMFIILLPFIVIGQKTSPIKSFCDSLSDEKFQLQIYPFMPVYPGGPEMMFKFISDNLKVPVTVDSTKGRVIAYLHIDSKGHVSNVCVFKGEKNISSTTLGIEIERVIMMMPNWTPAEKNGIKVPIRIFIPIKIE